MKKYFKSTPYTSILMEETENENAIRHKLEIIVEDSDNYHKLSSAIEDAFFHGTAYFKLEEDVKGVEILIKNVSYKKVHGEN